MIKWVRASGNAAAYATAVAIAAVCTLLTAGLWAYWTTTHDLPVLNHHWQLLVLSCSLIGPWLVVISNIALRKQPRN